MNSKKIGLFILERRKDLGFTQQQLAEQLGVSNKTISKWETGEGYPDITIVLDLSKELCVTADELLNGEMFQRDNNSNLNNQQLDIKNVNSKKQSKLTSSRNNFLCNNSSWSFECILAGGGLFFFLFALDGAMTEFEERKIMIGLVMAVILIIAGIVLEAAHKAYK